MPIDGSGEIQLSDIYNEFTGTHTGSQEIQLTDYYSKGDAPSSGEIQLATDFYGASSMSTPHISTGLDGTGKTSINHRNYPSGQNTKTSNSADVPNHTDRLMLCIQIACHQSQSSQPYVLNSMSWDGDALTQLTLPNYSASSWWGGGQNGGGELAIQIFYMVNPKIGDFTLSGTWSGNNAGAEHHVGVYHLSGVNTTTPFGTTFHQQGENNNENNNSPSTYWNNSHTKHSVTDGGVDGQMHWAFCMTKQSESSNMMKIDDTDTDAFNAYSNLGTVKGAHAKEFQKWGSSYEFQNSSGSAMGRAFVGFTYTGGFDYVNDPYDQQTYGNDWAYRFGYFNINGGTNYHTAVIAWQGDRGLFVGGYTGSYYEGRMETFGIATHGTAADLGDLQRSKGDMDGVSSRTRVCWMVGYNGSAVNQDIDIHTVANAANCTSGGSYRYSLYSVTPMSNGTLGVGAGGRVGQYWDAVTVSHIEKFTIASVSGSSNFGSLLSTHRTFGAAGISNATRGVIVSGYTAHSTNTYATEMSYITFASPGNAADYADLSGVGKSAMEGAENATRGVFAGGNIAASPYNTAVIEYITVATTNNAASQGNLSVAMDDNHTAVDSGRVVIAGKSGSYASTQNVYTFNVASGGGADTNSDIGHSQNAAGGCQGY